ncbi:MAG TPA: alpha/beta hydrolase [Brevundimonas sp.]|jgi:pimeloyl-ACP methyl ester carboxylesterase|uniref:alpha/beta fold hydrolase n=1 Tax=Brevundimonas sp. TaxID=1871086 RepID=UPI002DF10F5E|nr:alpha/beta hydrolase [Brevundimonas sp.]
MFLFAFVQRLFALHSLAVLGVAVWLLVDWWNIERIADAFDQPEPGNGRLWWGLGLLAWSLLGRLPVLLLLGRGGGEARRDRPEGATMAGADGAELWVGREGAGSGPILLLTHGWGMNCRVWAEARRELGARHELVLWDLPGCGKSGRPKAGWSIEGFAEDLAAVLDALPPDRQVILIGHSIGGMITQTLCARRPALLGTRVAGIVLENTTHTNPLRTMILSRLATALQPAIEGACRLETLIWPVTWLMAWQSWMSGSTHVAMRLTGFGTRPTREQLDRAALLVTRTSPRVQAMGNLAMLRWSVTDRLADVDVPALVLVGGRDLVTSDHAGETIADALPQARLARIPEAGHMGPVEAADAHHLEIEAFLADLAEAGRDVGRPDASSPAWAAAESGEGAPRTL